MRETNRRAAEQHELAARAHRTAAEHNEKGDNEAGNWHAERALEYSDRAYQLAKGNRNTRLHTSIPGKPSSTPSGRIR